MIGRLDSFKKTLALYRPKDSPVEVNGEGVASNGGHSTTETEGLSNLKLYLFHCTMPVSSFSLVLIHSEELYFDCSCACLKID